jgi:heme-degrading monooxygenase HmoA
MIILTVKFKSALSDSDVLQVMKERAPGFRALPGLIQKYYGREKETGEFTGIYVWDSEESLREYRETELARTIPEAYKAEGQPRIEVFEVPLMLRS